MKKNQTVFRPSKRLNTKAKSIAMALSLLAISSVSVIGTAALAQTEQAAPVISSSAEQDEKQNKAKQKAKVKAPGQKSSAKKDNKAASDTFKPSEEISEDLPVSFPVDI